MSLRVFVVTSLSAVICFLTSARVTPTLAIEPFAPYSVAGNPSDDYQYTSFFPLLRFIQPESLIVYENQDENRDYNIHPCDGGDTRPTTCTPNRPYCEGTIQYCNANEQVIRTDSVTGSCTGLTSESPPDATGTCVYPKKNPTIYVDPQATDFSRDSSSQTAAKTPNLALPKYQNEALRYENPGGGNTLTWGSHFLTLSRCERAARQLMVAYQAYETHQTVQGGEWPLGWVDWGYQTRNGKTLLQTWDVLAAAGLTNIAQQLVNGQDQFFLSLGTTQAKPPDSNADAVNSLCQRISSGGGSDWLRSLELLPLYPPSFRQGFVRTSICVWDICLPGKNSEAGQGLYADTSIHAAYAASVYDLLQNYPLSQALDQLNQIAKLNPLIRYSLISKKIATPPAISQSLTAQSQLSPFTLGTLGHVYDYQELMRQYHYTLAPLQSLEEGGAFPESLISQAINFVYGPVDSFAFVTNHLLSIPEPLGQSLFKIQQPVYQTRDPLSEQSDDFDTTLSNIIDGGSLFLLASKGSHVFDARRRMSLFACPFPEFAAYKVIDNSIKNYALGLGIGCDLEPPVPTGQCDGVAFGQLIEGSNYRDPIPQADSAFNSSQSLLTPDLINVYAAAAQETGVPCEILAGIHYVEADLNPNGSLISGRAIGSPEPDAGNQTFSTLLDTAIYAGHELINKANHNLKEVEDVILALSRYNGGGNSNCQAGYPYPIPYTGCPALFEGEDDIYPMNWIDDKHSTMYLLYCADLTACEPAVWERMGALTFAVEMYNNMTSSNNP